jgi:hypothetical protein
MMKTLRCVGARAADHLVVGQQRVCAPNLVATRSIPKIDMGMWAGMAGGDKGANDEPMGQLDDLIHSSALKLLGSRDFELQLQHVGIDTLDG